MRVSQGIENDRGYVKIRIWLGPKYNPDGSYNKPYRRSMGCWCTAHIMEAKNHIDEVRANFEKGIRPQREVRARLFVEVCDLFHKHWYANKQGRSARSIREVGYLIKRYKQEWPTHPFHGIYPKDIEAYMVNRAAEGAGRGTIRHEVNILSTIFEVIPSLIRRKDIDPFLVPDFNPCQDVERPAVADLKRKRIATRAELMAVKAYGDHYDPEMLELITRTIISGLRRGNLEESQGKEEVRGILSKSKGRKVFHLPLNWAVPTSFKNFPARWNKLRRFCKMTDFHWHDWRHVTGTMLMDLGFTEDQAREFFDHSSIQTTRIYTNGRQERVRPMVEKLRTEIQSVFAKAPAIKPEAPVLTGKSKACRGCGITKDFAAFHVHNGFADGVDSRCKDCNRARKNAYKLRQKMEASKIIPGVANGVAKRQVLIVPV